MALLALLVIIGSVEVTLNNRGKPRLQTLPNSNMRQFMMSNTGNSKLASSVYDGLALAGGLTFMAAVYGYVTVSWMTTVLLDSSNIAMRDQPMDIFIFILLLVPILYLVAPYPVQRMMLQVPRWARIATACVAVVLLFGQTGSAFFATIGLVVTTFLVAMPLLLYRGTKDQNHKVSAGVSLAIACVLVATVMLGWSWTAATAGCLPASWLRDSGQRPLALDHQRPAENACENATSFRSSCLPVLTGPARGAG